MGKRQFSKILVLLISMAMLVQLVIPVNIFADEGQAVPEPAEGDISELVTAEEETKGGLITAYVELAEEIRWQNTDLPDLPGTVSGTVNDEVADIPVTWEADHEYDADFPAGLYVFTALPDEGYTVATGVEAPRITVYIPAAQMAARMAGGGTDTSPLEITTAAQLAEIAAMVNAGRLETFLFNDSNATVYLQMGADIDLSGYGENWNDGKGWVPIGSDVNPFKGSFDGGGKTITGLYINDSALDYAGLFGCVNAYSSSVHDMGLTGVSINARNYVGGIAGTTSAHEVKVYNCVVSGSVKGHDGVGGVVGLFYGSLGNCLSACNITATGGDAGGVAGMAGLNSRINACYAIGTVSGGINVGGVAGLLYNSVTDCAALNPSVSGSSNVGRMAGSLLMTGSLSGNAAFAGMTGGGSDKTATGLDGEDMAAAAIKADGSLGGRFTAANGWMIENGKLPGLFGTALDMPVHITGSNDANFPGEGTIESPFLISMAEKLALLATLVNNGDTVYNDKYYKLTADLDLSGYGASFNGGKGWIPIGNDPNFFKGHFDGGGKTVAGLYINDGSRNYAGLFGYVSGGTLENFTVSGAVGGNNNVGMAAGYLNSTTIQNCHASGTVSGKSYNVGGVAGDVYNSSRMLSCSAAVDVSGESYTYNSGGVAGTIEKSSIIQDCYATGNVNAGSTTGGSAGGVVGNVYDGANTVRNCYSTGAVSSKNYVGGVAGTVEYGSHIVQNCAALNPSISSAGTSIGRVAGYKASDSTLADNAAFDWILNKSGGQLSTASDATGIHGASRTADQLQLVTNLPGDFGSDPWTYADGSLPGLFGETVPMPAHIRAKLTVTNHFAGGDGTSGTPYLINTATQLAKLAELVNAGDTNYNDKYYKLIADLDLSGYGPSNTGFNDGKGWVPIGKAEAAPFKGHFDGNHKTISGLYINNEFQNYYAGGLFGYLNNGSVSNLAVTDVNITTTGMGSVGVVAGYMDSYSVVQGCYTTGAISGGFSGAGGIAGQVGLVSVVQNCYTTAAVSGSGTMGGIAGTAGSGAKVQNCYVTGNFNGNSYTGGVAGFLTNGTIQNCVVLSPGVTQDNWVKRILGRAYNETSTLYNNHAFSGMLSGGTDKTANGLDGADVSIQTALRGISFWRDIMNWDTAVWTIIPGKLPTLIGFSGQSGDGGLYLTERDIQYATITVNGAYTYTGLPITPDITVSFDGATLVKDTDYTVTVTSTDGPGTSAGANAGTVTLMLTGIGNFTGEKTGVSYTIAPKALTEAMLTLEEGPFTYTGLAQEPGINMEDGGQTLLQDDDYLTSYTGNINAGTASVSVTGKDNYQGTVSRDFTIGKAALTITGGTVAPKTYDSTTDADVISVTFSGLQHGETLTLGTDYTVTGAVFDSTSAGGGKTVTGIVVLGGTPKAGNYTLSDGSLTLSGQAIGKAAAPAGVNQTFNAVKGHARNYEFDLTTLLPDLTGTLGTVTYAPVITPNGDGVLNTGTFTYTSGEKLTIPVQSVADADKTATITVTISSINYNDFTAVITVKIVDTIPLTVTGLTVNTKTYDGTVAAVLSGTAELVLTNIAPGEDVTLSGIPSAAFNNANAGTNKAVVVTGLSLIGNEAYKYRLELSGFIGTIEPKTLTDSMLTLAGGSFTYTGVEQEPDITVQDGSTTLTPDTDYLTSYAGNINVGTAGVSADGIGNYQGKASKSFTIGKVPLTIIGGTIETKAYDSTTDAAIVAVAFGGLQNGESLTLGTDYTVTGAAFDSASVGGGKTVTAIVTLNNTAKANNYTLDNGSLTLSGQTIQKGMISDVTYNMGVATNLAKDYTLSYQEFETLLAGFTGKDDLGTVSYDLTTVDNADGVMAALPQTGPFTFPATISVARITTEGKEAKLIGTVTSANYSDFTVTIVIRMVNRIPVTISGVTMAGGVYNGSSCAYSGTPLFSLNDSPVSIPEFDVQYESTDGAGYSGSAAPKNAGAYQLTIAVPNNNPVYAGSKSYAFTIEKRPVTVKADGKSMTRGGALPAFTYTVDGQLSGETALIGTPTVSCTADGKTAGSYPITVNLTGITYTDNYTAAGTAFESGTLTVNNPSTGGNDGTSNPPVTPPAQGQQTQTTIIGNTVTVTITAATITSSSGNASSTVTQTQLSDAITSAVTLAQSQAGDMTVQVAIVVQAPSAASTVDIVLPQGALGQAVQNGVGALTVSTPMAYVTFDSSALLTLAGTGTGTTDINIARADSGSLPPATQQLVGVRTALDFSVTSGEVSISQLGGNAEIFIPYTPTADEDTDLLVGCHVSPSGGTQILGGSYVSPQGSANGIPGISNTDGTFIRGMGDTLIRSGGVVFNTDHFSTYAVAYNKVTFKDVAENAWYKKAVGFIAARQITTGTGAGNFSPGARLTRGEFLVMMMRAYRIAPDTSSKDNFSDSGNTYYTGYLAAAKRLGISGGIGNNMFAPEKEITRQEMFTLLYNALKVINRLPQGDMGKPLSAFSDAGQIASYAKDAMTLMVQTGIVSGSGGKLTPMATTTRAEMAQVLYNLLSKQVCKN